MSKHKQQQFILKKASQIKEEYQEKLNEFFDNLDNFVKEKNFSFHEISLVYFECLYRFKREIPKNISDIIFEESKNENNLLNEEIEEEDKENIIEEEITKDMEEDIEGDITNNKNSFSDGINKLHNFKDGVFRKSDLIKLSYILSRFRLLLNTKENAEVGIENILRAINKIGLKNFSKEELLALVTNLSYRSIYPDLHFFTKLEPHLLKYFNNYSVSSLVSIFFSYIKNYRGSNFFIQTLGFSISSNLEFCSSKGMREYIIEIFYKINYE